MNSIDKLKRYKKWRSLYGYSTMLSIFLLSSIFRDNLTITDLLSFLFLLPLPFYFALRTYKASQKIIVLRRNMYELNDLMPSTHFSLISFLTQPSVSFRLSIILILLTIWTGMARSYADQKNLQANHSTINSILLTNN